MGESALGKAVYYAVQAIWFLALLCSLARPAHAYVDPGSGLLLYQVGGSLFAGLLLLLRKRARKLFGMLSGKTKRDTGEAGPP
jgi:hypothetical protein